MRVCVMKNDGEIEAINHATYILEVNGVEVGTPRTIYNFGVGSYVVCALAQDFPDDEQITAEKE